MIGTPGFKVSSNDDDMERVIEKSETSSSINSDEHVKKPKTCREQLNHVLHTNKFQIAVICLVVLDCILVITELLIDLKAFETDQQQPPPEEDHGDPGEGQEHNKNPSLIAAEILHYFSIAILAVFLVELGLKLFAMRTEFFRHKMEVIDGVIVVVSFSLDVAFAGEDAIDGALGLLIILRLWRVGRILNGIILSVKTQDEKKLAKERHLREAAEEELVKFREYCAAQEREIEALQSLLTKNNIEFKKMEKPQLSFSTISVVAEVNQYIQAAKLASSENNSSTNS